MHENIELRSLFFHTGLKELLAIQYKMKLSTSAVLFIAAVSMMSMPNAASSVDVQVSSCCSVLCGNLMYCNT